MYSPYAQIRLENEDALNAYEQSQAEERERRETDGALHESRLHEWSCARRAEEYRQVDVDRSSAMEKLKKTTIQLSEKTKVLASKNEVMLRQRRLLEASRMEREEEKKKLRNLKEELRVANQDLTMSSKPALQRISKSLNSLCDMGEEEKEEEEEEEEKEEEDEQQLEVDEENEDSDSSSEDEDDVKSSTTAGSSGGGTSSTSGTSGNSGNSGNSATASAADSDDLDDDDDDGTFESRLTQRSIKSSVFTLEVLHKLMPKPPKKEAMLVFVRNFSLFCSIILI